MFPWRELRSLLRRTIPDVGRMFKCERPQLWIELLRPMDQLVHHHRTGPVGIGLQGTFGYSILEVSSDSTESEGLVLSFAVSDKGWFTKGVIVGSIGLHFDTKLAHEGFKLMFGLQGFTNPERDLVTSEGKPGGMINKHSATCTPHGIVFFSKRIS